MTSLSIIVKRSTTCTFSLKKLPDGVEPLPIALVGHVDDERVARPSARVISRVQAEVGSRRARGRPLGWRDTCAQSR
jgi:hypothetical protein